MLKPSALLNIIEYLFNYNNSDFELTSYPEKDPLSYMILKIKELLSQPNFKRPQISTGLKIKSYHRIFNLDLITFRFQK